MPVRLLQRYYTSRDFSELKVYREENPHPFTRIIYQLAQIAWWTYAANVKKEDRTLEYDDFVMKFGHVRKTQTQNDMERIARRFCMATGWNPDNGNNSKLIGESNG